MGGCTQSRPLPNSLEAKVFDKQSKTSNLSRKNSSNNTERKQISRRESSCINKTNKEIGGVNSISNHEGHTSRNKENNRNKEINSNGEKQQPVKRRLSIGRRLTNEFKPEGKQSSDSNSKHENDNTENDENNSKGNLKRNSGSAASGGTRSGSSKGLNKNESMDQEFFGLDMNYTDMELRDSIGSGTYGQVFKCRYKGKMFALKKVFLPESSAERAEMLEDFAKEVGILSVLRHDRIVKFKGAVRKHPTYALLFELCEGCVGTLLRMVRRRKVQVTWSICVTIAKDCAEAVSYLHSLRPRILHRDLKSENLLLTSRFRCKLTDFGLSRVYEGRKRTMTVCGTPCWVAPEIFRGEPYNEKIDVYSFGVVLWELFVGKKPYTEYESVELPYRVGKKGLRPPCLRHCPPSINRLMKDCWHENSALRPTFPEIEKRLALIENELEIAGVINSPAHQIKVSWGEQLAITNSKNINASAQQKQMMKKHSSNATHVDSHGTASLVPNKTSSTSVA